MLKSSRSGRIYVYVLGVSFLVLGLWSDLFAVEQDDPENHNRDRNKMNSPAKLVSLVALAATVAPSLLFFAGVIGHEGVKWITLAGTLLWFVATPLWMGRELSIDAEEVEI